MHTVQINDVFRDQASGSVLILERELFHRSLFLFVSTSGNQIARSLKGLERIGHTIVIH